MWIVHGGTPCFVHHPKHVSRGMMNDNNHARSQIFLQGSAIQEGDGLKEAEAQFFGRGGGGGGIRLLQTAL